MLRLALLVAPFVVLGCASSPTSPAIAGDVAKFSFEDAPPSESLAGTDVAAGDFADFAPASPMAQAPPPQTPRNRQRFSIKGGYYSSSDDGIDDGGIINLSWKRPTSEILSSEVEIGYLDASGSDNGIDRDVWAVPLMVNGRVDFPVGQRIELYGGLGLGSFYYDAEAKTSGLKVSTDGFLFGGNAFFGGVLHVGPSMSLGLEGKYYVTDNVSELDGGLDAFVVLLTLGFDR